MNTDIYFMQQAIILALKAQKTDEVPVGAVAVLDNQIIGEGWNQPISLCDPTAHAEIIALRAAAKHINNYRLLNCTLYVTLEPCIMCIGTMIHSRIKRLVFGAPDPKTGAVGSILNVLETKGVNHQIEVTGEILSQDCSELLKTFFQKKR